MTSGAVVSSRCPAARRAAEPRSDLAPLRRSRDVRLPRTRPLPPAKPPLPPRKPAPPRRRQPLPRRRPEAPPRSPAPGRNPAGRQPSWHRTAWGEPPQRSYPSFRSRAIIFIGCTFSALPACRFPELSCTICNFRQFLRILLKLWIGFCCDLAHMRVSLLREQALRLHRPRERRQARCGRVPDCLDRPMDAHQRSGRAEGSVSRWQHP